MSRQIIQAKAKKSVDQELAEHLKRAEESLIEAVKLFGRGRPPVRHPSYAERLTRAQEAITTLYREELVRIRGPIKVSRTERSKNG